MNNMIVTLCSLLVCISITPTVHAGGDGDLWAPFVVFTCLEQDPVNKQTLLGKQYTADPKYQAFITSVQGKGFQCVAKEKIIPQALCTTILNHVEDTTKSINLNAMREEYSSNLDQLGEAARSCELVLDVE